jgi:hypothetical protein
MKLKMWRFPVFQKSLIKAHRYTISQPRKSAEQCPGAGMYISTLKKGLVAPLIAMTACILLACNPPEDRSHFLRAIKEVVELRTDESQRFNALPDGTLVAIHGFAQGAQLLTDGEAGISGVGYFLERKHDVLQKSFGEKVTGSGRNQVRSYVVKNQLTPIYDGEFPSLRWPKQQVSMFRFGPIVPMPRTPGISVPMFPNPAAQAKLYALGFRNGPNSCLVKLGDDGQVIERICWHLQQAQEQTYYGAKQGHSLVDWKTDSGTIVRRLEQQRIDPKIVWQKAFSAPVE